MWATIPVGLDAAKVFQSPVKRKVAIVPGEPFHPCGSVKNTMRLNFFNATPEYIHEGIFRLSQVMKEIIDHRVFV